MQPELVAKPKLKGLVASQKPVPKIDVKVSCSSECYQTEKCPKFVGRSQKPSIVMLQGLGTRLQILML